MRKIFLLIFMVLLVQAGPVLAKSGMPAFKDYPAPVATHKKPVAVKLSTAKSRQFASMLGYKSKQPIDFAGHYILALWGCGAGCVMGGAIDTQNGHVVMLPFMITVTDWPKGVLDPLYYRKDSRLFIFQGRRNVKNKDGAEGSYYYEFDGKRFNFLEFIEREDSSTLTEPGSD